MKIIEFINGYKQLSNEEMKKKYVQGVLKNTYVPYEEKILCARKCLREHFNEEGMIYQNTPMAYLQFVMCSLRLYTTLEVDNGQSDKEIYDALQEYSLVNEILQLLGETLEYREFNTVYGMCVADFETNTLTPRGFIQLQVNKLGQEAQALAEYLAKLDLKALIEKFKKK